MQRSTQIILSVFAGLAVLVVIGAGFAGWYVVDNAERWAQGGRDRYEAGRAAGAALDSRACVDRAMAVYREDTGPIMAVTQRLWLSGCLETATPDAAVCPRIQAESTVRRIGELIASRSALCARHGLAADQNCPQLAEAVEAFCFGTEIPESKRGPDNAQPRDGSTRGEGRAATDGADDRQ